MLFRTTHSRFVAAMLAAALVATASPVLAAPEGASLAGVIQTAPNAAPLAGARLLAADPAGTIVRSEPTGADGRFALEGLAPSRYELAVESDGALFLVESPVLLEPGVARRVDLAIQEGEGGDPTGPETLDPKTGPWNNPLTAALIVAGAAVVLGIAVDSATEDDGSPN